MPSSYTTSLRLTLPATGELSGTWGSTVNTGITELLDAAVAGTASISTWGGAGVAYTLSNNSGTADEARRMFLVATGTPGEAKNVICPAVSKMYVFRNDTTGGFALTLKTSGGTGISVPAGQYKFLYCDGTNVVETFNSAGALTLSGALSVGGTATFAANPTLSAGTANQVQYLNASKVLVGSANLTFDGTALTLGGNPTLSAGTANGVTYLNGSKVLTSGSALTFNGTSLGVASVASTAALSLSSATSTAINLNIGGTELARLSANVNGIFTVGTEGSVAGLGTGYATLGAYGTNGGGFRIYRGTGAGTSSAFFYADSTGTFLGSAENTSLIFNQNNTERARITSAGSFVAGAQAALATTATDGFLYVPTCAGTPTGVPTAITGMAPIVVNTTNNKLYFYSGGAWRDAGP
jgi:hypothetical protein